jgi:hypothetical protein
MKILLNLFLFLLPLVLFGQKNNDFVYVSDLDLRYVDQPWWTPQKDKAINGEKIRIAGKDYKKGIGTISGSRIFIFLNGRSDTFKSLAGIQDKQETPENIKFNALGDGTKLFYTENKNGKKFFGIGNTPESIRPGSVHFEIKGDGETLWKSKKITGGISAVPVKISVKGIQILELIVEDMNDGISGDLAVWIYPKLIFNDYKPQIVDKDYFNRQKKADTHFVQHIAPAVNKLPSGNKVLKEGIKEDWLIHPVKQPSVVYKDDDQKQISISNGLISRTFQLTPNCATVEFKNLVTGESLLRGVSPEAILKIDGKAYLIGGLEGQEQYAYLKPEWLSKMWSPPGSFQLLRFETGELKPRINWKNKRWSLKKKEPLKGRSLTFYYIHPEQKGIEVAVHYNIYDGIPLISKWFTIDNKTTKAITLNSFKSEIVAMVEPESSVERGETGWEEPNIHIESDYAFHAMSFRGSNKVVHWEKDSRYTSQVNYLLNTPCLLECKPPIGPEETINPGKQFESFRVWEMPFDSYDKQRKGLATNRFYSLIAPWTTENPMFLHLTTTDNKKVKRAIDQCAETGYEMVILSFGSGLNMEDISEKNISKYKALADYAHSKGIELGGYSLLSSRWISEEVDVINPKTGKRGGVIHGSAPCLNSQWGIDYFKKLKTFIERTGFDLLEHDGSYPGQLCASTEHVGHKGLEDSQWKAWKRITGFYKWCNENGVSLNIPDWYYLSGSTKNGIGYREVNWSLPREQQLILGRQNIYDGTWERTPTMSWTFVPLTQYHGGGAAATIEPLHEHLNAYKAHMIQNYGSGVQACYRGPRLYDTNETKETVKEVVNWYKKHREILNSPLIHLKRADGRSIDGLMHVNPELDEKALAIFFNPTNDILKERFKLPLYYTGLKDSVRIGEKGANPKTYKLTRDYSVELEVEIPANSYTWFLIE